MKPLGSTDPSAVASYRLIGVLGGGGMGRVFLGESRTGRRVAIKVVREELAEDPVFRRRFAREVAAAKMVNPLYTAAVVDSDPNAEAPWLATTYIEGPNLTELVLGDGPLSPRAVLTLAAGLSEALASIHRVGLVHRDLKPSNVIINDSGPHIIDFGIALTLDATGRLTTSRVVGTPSYIAPEIIHGGEPSTAGDVFSLGATLVFAATGKHLVADGTVYAQIMQITTGRFELDAVPKELRPLVVRCISPESKDRPTADELAHILVAAGVAPPSEGWYRGSGPAPVVALGPAARTLDRLGVNASRSKPTKVQLSRRRLLAIGGLVAGAALGSAAGMAAGWFGRRPAESQVAWHAGPASGSPNPTAPPTPATGRGTVLWDGTSAARPASVTGAQQPGVRVIADPRKQIIAADGPDVVAVNPEGTQLWKKQLSTSTSSVNLRPWGDALLATDARTVWVLDPATGEARATYAAAEQEEIAAQGANPDNLAIEIGAVSLSPARVFIGLGTSVIALDRGLALLWREPRPYGRRVPISSPRTASDTYVALHTVDDDLVQVALHRADNGHREWFVSYSATVGSNVGGPPPPPPPGASGDPGGDDGRPPRPLDDKWSTTDGRFSGGRLAVRDSQAYRVLDLANAGRTIWQGSVDRPVSSFEIVSDLLVVSSDQVRAFALDTGTARWEKDMRGAEVAITPDGTRIIIANEDRILVLKLDGEELWQAPLPAAMAGMVSERLTTDDHTAYLTFQPAGSPQRSGPPAVDALAISLDN